MESPLNPLSDSGLQSCQQVPAVTTTTTPAEQGGSSADDSISHDADALANNAVDSTNNSGEDRLTGQNDIVSKEKRQNCPEKSELLSTISTESVSLTMASVDCTNTTVLTTDTLAESGSSKMIEASHLCDQDQGLSTIANRQNAEASSQDTTSSNLQETDHNLPRPVAVDGQPDQVAACVEHDNAQNRDTQAVSNCLEANSMQQHLTSSSQEDQLNIVDGGDSEAQPIAADGGDSSETVKQGAPPLESGSEHSTISQVEEKLVVAIPPEKKKNIDESKPGSEGNSVGTVLAARSDEAVTKEHSPVAAAAAPSDSAGAVSATPAAGATGAATCSRSQSEDKGSASECDNVDSAPSVYSVKWVMFKGNKVPIITQNENGPCPLIAIMNVLLLMKKIPFPAPMEMVTSDQLMSYLGEYVFERVPKDISEDSRLNYEQNMQDAMAVFHKLQTGLDVNVKFTGVRDFEYTPECIIFDLLDIRLYHGWLVDPQEPKVGEAIGNCSYNQLVEKIIALKSSDKEDQVTEALIAEAFLESSASQLTYHGLCELSTTVKEGELCVCFRNNHFSTLYRHKGELFILVTDQGFLTEPNVVWETLSNVEGDCHFVDANFHTYTKPELPPLAASDLPAGSEQQIDQDYLVALSLQQEQVEPGAVWNQQQQQQQGAPPSSQPLPSVPTVPLSDHELAMRLQEEEDRRAAAAFQQQQQQQQQTAAGPPAGPGGQQPRAPGGQPSGASGVRRPRDRDRDREKKDKDGCLIL